MGRTHLYISSYFPSRMRYINQFIRLILVGWIGAFTQISTTHLGHGHDILPDKASVCTIDCEEQSHHSAGQACEWFMAKRLTDNDGIIYTISEKYLVELSNKGAQ